MDTPTPLVPAPQPPPTTRPPAVPPARLTVVESVYYQSPPDPPTQTDSRYSVPLAAGDQLYTRRLTAGSDWQPLPLGWDGPGSPCHTLLIYNDEGKGRTTVPTPAELAETATRVLEVWAVPAKPPTQNGQTMLDPPLPPAPQPVPVLVVRPSESCRLSPTSGIHYFVRAAAGTVKFTVVAVPGGVSG